MLGGKVYFNIHYYMYIWGMTVFTVALCAVTLPDVALISPDVALTF